MLPIIVLGMLAMMFLAKVIVTIMLSKEDDESDDE